MLLGIALTLPIIAGVKLDLLDVGITITVGAMLASPSDVSGSIKHKTKGLLLATFLAMAISLLGGYLHFTPWLLFPILGILIFGISYISIYGFRASLISFSGLFALVLQGQGFGRAIHGGGAVARARARPDQHRRTGRGRCGGVHPEPRRGGPGDVG